MGSRQTRTPTNFLVNYVRNSTRRSNINQKIPIHYAKSIPRNGG